MSKILILEDSELDQKIYTNLFARENNLLFVEERAQLRNAIETFSPDLLILDLFLKDGCSLELFVELNNASFPIIAVTAETSGESTLKALSAGVNDYILKPCDLRLLKLKIDNWLRKINSKPLSSKIETPLLSFEPDQLTVKIKSENRSETLSPLESKLLALLMNEPERVFSRSTILDKVWGDAVYVGERSVDTCISQLRKKIKPYSSLIKSNYGGGYSFSLSNPNILTKD